MGEFEKDIRDMFVDLEVDIDTNQLWKGIEKKLDKKDKKRPVWWFIIPLILLPILFYTIYTKSNNPENIDSKIAKTTITNTKNNIANTKEISETKTAQPDNENANPSDPKLTKTELTKAELGADSKLQDKSKQTAYTSGKTNHKNTLISGTLTGDTAIGSTAQDNSIAIDEKKDVETDTQNSEVITGNKEKRLRYNILRIGQIIDALVNDNTYELSLNNFKPEINIKEHKEMKSAWKKSLDMGIGFALVNKSLNAIDNSFGYYKDKRESTEAYLEAINANLALNMKSKSGFFVSTGINYTQIDERFTSKDSVDLVTSKTGVTKEITEADGTITVIRSQKDVVNFIKWDKIIYNYYHFIDIPVSVGYSFDINNWKLELSSGVSYNIAFAKRGQIIGVDYYPVDINDKGVFKSNVGLSFISDMKVLFNIKNRMFYIEPNIKYNLGSITAKENPIGQKYFTYGIKIGSRFSF